jgi:hypothetical protein
MKNLSEDIEYYRRSNVGCLRNVANCSVNDCKSRGLSWDRSLHDELSDASLFRWSSALFSRLLDFHSRSRTLRQFKRQFQFTAVLAPIRWGTVVAVWHASENLENHDVKRGLSQNQNEAVSFSPLVLPLVVSLSLPKSNSLDKHTLKKLLVFWIPTILRGFGHGDMR